MSLTAFRIVTAGAEPYMVGIIKEDPYSEKLL